MCHSYIVKPLLLRLRGSATVQYRNEAKIRLTYFFFVFSCECIYVLAPVAVAVTVGYLDFISLDVRHRSVIRNGCDGWSFLVCDTWHKHCWTVWRFEAPLQENEKKTHTENDRINLWLFNIWRTQYRPLKMWPQRCSSPSNWLCKFQ